MLPLAVDLWAASKAIKSTSLFVNTCLSCLPSSRFTLFLFTYWSSCVVVVVYTVQYLPDVVDEAAIAASHILQVGPHTN